MVTIFKFKNYLILRGFGRCKV